MNTIMIMIMIIIIASRTSWQGPYLKIELKYSKTVNKSYSWYFEYICTGRFFVARIDYRFL